MAFKSQDTVIGLSTNAAVPCVLCEGAEAALYGNCLVHKTHNEYTAFVKENKNGLIYFAFSLSTVSEPEAIDKARKVLEENYEKVFGLKLEFYKNLPSISGLSPEVEKTLYKCFSVMETQVYTPEGRFQTRWTTPDRLPHRNLWLWDSVFHSMGNKYISNKLAYESIEAVLSTQREDGLIAHNRRSRL